MEKENLSLSSDDDNSIELNEHFDIKEEPEIHPCKYCGTSCKGKQCKQCHLKMVYKKQECNDCKKNFIALRCFSCQIDFNERMSECPDCGKLYYGISKDGKIFKKCFDCHQNDFANCKNCGKKCFKKYSFCKDCNYNDKNNDKNSIENLNNCRTKDCNNKTKLMFCSECYTNFKIINNHEFKI
jgi:hypothetical protein